MALTRKKGLTSALLNYTNSVVNEHETDDIHKHKEALNVQLKIAKRLLVNYAELYSKAGKQGAAKVVKLIKKDMTLKDFYSATMWGISGGVLGTLAGSAINGNEIEWVRGIMIGSGVGYFGDVLKDSVIDKAQSLFDNIKGKTKEELTAEYFVEYMESNDISHKRDLELKVLWNMDKGVNSNKVAENIDTEEYKRKWYVTSKIWQRDINRSKIEVSSVKKKYGKELNLLKHNNRILWAHLRNPYKHGDKYQDLDLKNDLTLE